MNVLDLFSGIGGFSLGLERAGMRTVAFCEIEPFCRDHLAEQWPHVPLYGDIRALNADRITTDVGPIDLICGGFPCQDISVGRAGKSTGLDGPDSGLWHEYARLVRELRPTWVVIENSPRLRTLGADRVLADLEGCGYACWPLVVGAVHAGSPQVRKRAFIVAHASSDGRGQGRPRGSAASPARLHNDTHGGGTADLGHITHAWEDGPFDGEPVADGLPEDVDAAIKAYGNAVLPQLTELIGRAILRCAQ